MPTEFVQKTVRRPWLGKNVWLKAVGATLSSACCPFENRPVSVRKLDRQPQAVLATIGSILSESGPLTIPCALRLVHDLSKPANWRPAANRKGPPLFIVHLLKNFKPAPPGLVTSGWHSGVRLTWGQLLPDSSPTFSSPASSSSEQGCGEESFERRRSMKHHALVSFQKSSLSVKWHKNCANF